MDRMDDIRTSAPNRNMQMRESLQWKIKILVRVWDQFESQRGTADAISFLFEGGPRKYLEKQAEKSWKEKDIVNGQKMTKYKIESETKLHRADRRWKRENAAMQYRTGYLG